jgi:CRP-like cAMP-binding protein
MTLSQAVPVTNRLLDALPDNDRRNLLSACEQVELAFGNVLYVPGENMRYVYFPTNSFISLLTPIEGHGNLEVALIGNEGMYGIPLLLGVDVTSMHGVVQGSGPAWRMDVGLFQRELKHSVALQQSLNHYLYVLMIQLAQTAACNRYHVVEERIARWLLMTRDRAHADDFHITHEYLAHMLGVRRVGVTKAAGALQRKKLISYSRGKVRINDIAGLESVSCSCYLEDKNTYDRVMLAYAEAAIA